MAAASSTVSFFPIAACVSVCDPGDSVLGTMFTWNVLEYKNLSRSKCVDCEKGAVSLVKAS